MKKLLSIVLVALALCLAISAAIAVEGKPTEYRNVFYGPDDVWGTVTLTDGTTVKLQGFDDANWALYEKYQKDAALHGKIKTFLVSAIEVAEEEEPVASSEEVPSSEEVATEEVKRLVEIRVYINHVWETTVDADCTKGGTEKCKVCGFEQTFAPAEHLYEIRKEVKKETYCTAPEYADVCTRCGHEREGSRAAYAKEFKDYKPHTNEALKGKITEKWVLDGELNCMKTETTYHVVCSNCGKILLDEEGKERKDIKIDLDGYYENQKNFGVKLEEGWAGHVWDKWVKLTDASCVANATQKHWCKICNKTEVEEIEKTQKEIEWTLTGATCDMLDRSWEDWQWVLVCKHCNGEEGEGHYVELGEVRDSIDYNYEDENGKPGISFEYDGKTYVVYHQPDMEVAKKNIVNWYEAVCQAPRIGDTYCVRCGQWMEVEVAPKAAHNWSDWELVEDKAVTGTETSRWESYCLNDYCEEYRVRALAEKPVDPCAEDAHEWGIKDPKSVKCGENKDVEFECTICKATKTEDYTKAHDFSKVEVITEATCSKAGVCLKTCANCGYMEKGEIPVIAHTWDEGKITKEATKEAAGEKTFTCTVCGETKTEEVPYEVTAAAKYTITDLAYDGQTVTGKLVHTEDTLEAENLYVRVTFFLENNYYMATIGEVEADGTFSVDGVGPIEYISLVVNGNSSVNPDDVVALGSGEITVK